MHNRDQFEDYMRVLENRFYETVNLPKSPYVNARRREGEPLPVILPQDFGNSGYEAKRGVRGAEQLIDKLINLDRKRRGIDATDSNKAKRNDASLNLSGRLPVQYANPNYDRLQ